MKQLQKSKLDDLIEQRAKLAQGKREKLGKDDDDDEPDQPDEKENQQ